MSLSGQPIKEKTFYKYSIGNGREAGSPAFATLVNKSDPRSREIIYIGIGVYLTLYVIFCVLYRNFINVLGRFIDYRLPPAVPIFFFQSFFFLFIHLPQNKYISHFTFNLMKFTNFNIFSLFLVVTGMFVVTTTTSYSPLSRQ